MFDLLRPCVSCPFRIGQGERFQLHPERLEEIRRAVAFQCHKTVDYSVDRDDREARAGDKPQQCAGLMAVLTREGEPNQIMQIAERLRALDPSKLDPRGEAYASWADVERAHAEGR
ncbi:MAG: hypothetical protein NW206_19960 [Hyphomonadaceae bacterium]|nr:hypothetical protein [Hyphomonadaceae bacterium]